MQQGEQKEQISSINQIQIEESLGQVGEVINIGKCQQSALTQKAKCLSMIDMEEKVINEADEILQQYPESRKAQLMKFRAIDRQINYMQAINVVDRILTIDPKSKDAFKRIGIMQLKQKQRYYDQQSTDALWLTTSLLHNLDKSKMIMELADRTLKINPIPRYVLQIVFYALRHMSRFEGIIEVADKILKRDLKSQMALKNKMKALQNLQNYENAIQVADRILEIDAKSQTANKTKMSSLCCLSRYEEVIEIADRILHYDGNLTFALEKKQRYDEIFKITDEILQSNLISANLFDLIVDTIQFRLKDFAISSFNSYEQIMKIADRILSSNIKTNNSLKVIVTALKDLNRNQEAYTLQKKYNQTLNREQVFQQLLLIYRILIFTLICQIQRGSFFYKLKERITKHFNINQQYLNSLKVDYIKYDINKILNILNHIYFGQKKSLVKCQFIEMLI